MGDRIAVTYDCIGCMTCVSACDYGAIYVADVNGYFKNVGITKWDCVCCRSCWDACPIQSAGLMSVLNQLDCGVSNGSGGGGSGGNGSWGGGSSGGGNGAGAGLPFKNANLNALIKKGENNTFDEKTKLLHAMLMLEKYCFAGALINFLNINGITFSSMKIDSNMFGDSGYDFNNGTLKFRTLDSINFESLFHEIFHLFQVKYGNGTYANRGMMEYERTLFTDIAYTYSGHWEDRYTPWLDAGAPAVKSIEYRRWLKKFVKQKNIEKGILNADFYRFVDMFKTYNRAYSNYEYSNNYNKKAIEKAIKEMLDNCK